MPGLFDHSGSVLVIAPHPDDEILGCGGTIARLTDAQCDVHVALVTKGQEPRFSERSIERVRMESETAHALLKVSRTHYLDFPAAELDSVRHADLNSAIANLIEEIAPSTIFLPFLGDIHLDHQLVFRSGMVAARPRGDKCPTRILAYETLSESNWGAPYLEPGFIPNVFVDIEATLDRKLDAFHCFASQCRSFPSERSPEALRALATLRGATVHRRAAEAFILIREIC